MITKKPERKDNYNCEIYGYENARTAFEDILINLKSLDYTILMPGFIGYSPNEGSGVFDPILKTQTKYEFYKMTEELYVDITDLERHLVENNDKKAILLIHYFGYVDPQYEDIVILCKKYNIKIIEDSAHAFYTEYCKGSIGKQADYIIYSIHKLFPFENGGMLKVRGDKGFRTYHTTGINYDIWNYDLMQIAEKRVKNAQIIENKLRDEKGIRILRSMNKFENSIPQTFPILLEGTNRYQIYLKLNELGYGVVSLYHTLISPLYNDEFFISKNISDKILNLPVHQDVSENDLLLLCEALKREIGKDKKGMR